MGQYKSQHTGPQIDAGVDAALNPDTTPTAGSDALITSGGVKSALDTFVRPNLLDNWYFVGGGSQQGGGQFPINQRGQTTYNNPWTYSVDKWKLGGNGSIAVVSSGITITADFQQAIEKERLTDGETYTIATLSTDGVLGFHTFVYDKSAADYSTLFNVDAGNCYLRAYNEGNVTWFRIYGKGRTHIAAKLELGDTQTLARQVNGQWVLNDPAPNYQQELAKCQRYYVEVSCYPYTSNMVGSYLQTSCYFPVTMRTIPSVVLFSENTNAIGAVGDFINGGDFSNVTARVGAQSLDGVTSIQITVGTLPAGTIASIGFRASADL